MNTQDMIIFLYSVVVKNRNGTDFPCVSTFFKHLRKLQPVLLEGGETLIPLNRFDFKKKGKRKNYVTYKL